MENYYSRLACMASVLLLSACGGGSDPVPTTGTSSAPSATVNAAPSISGSPAVTVQAGTAYEFRPSAQDGDGDPLTFEITGRPSWATFDAATGRLSGIPLDANVGSSGDIVIAVTDQKARTALSSFRIQVTARSVTTPTPTPAPAPAPAPNAAPTITGSPATSVLAASSYTFTPRAADANGDALVFSIANRPTWAQFDTATGRLSGTPTTANVGTTSNVVISVSDGRATTSLAAFSISVTQVATGSATIEWQPPTTNTDGSALTDLAGYRITYGTSAATLDRTVQVTNPGVATYVVSNLSAGTWYFAVRAYNQAGVDSPASNVASKVVQ